MPKLCDVMVQSRDALTIVLAWLQEIEKNPAASWLRLAHFYIFLDGIRFGDIRKLERALMLTVRSWMCLPH